jgi:tRNA (cmo5U34)-methyltransferase
MLTRATERVSQATPGKIRLLQGDIREVVLEPQSQDIILAAAVLHHLRNESEWQTVFAKFYAVLRPGGSLWLSDLVHHALPAVQELMWKRYGDYLTQLKGEAYRDQVFAYIEKEDSPRPLLFQIDQLRAAGFTDVEILHKNSCFAAFGAKK